MNYLPPIAKVENKNKIIKWDKIKHHSRGRTEEEINLFVSKCIGRDLLKTSRPRTEIDNLGNGAEKTSRADKRTALQCRDSISESIPNIQINDAPGKSNYSASPRPSLEGCRCQPNWSKNRIKFNLLLIRKRGDLSTPSLRNNTET